MVLIAAGILAILAAGPVGEADAHGAPSAPSQEIHVPECRRGEAMPEGALFDLLEQGAGEKVEFVHSAGPDGSLIFTTNHATGSWSEILADGGTACLLRYGQDQETPA